VTGGARPPRTLAAGAARSRPARRPPRGPPELERARLFEATVELVERAAPVALLLEDVHAADAASLELAAYVARRIGPHRVLLVLTRRPFPATRTSMRSCKPSAPGTSR
jgi:hypothetical protein